MWLTKDEALAKLYRYCSYQERCVQEVRSKLDEWKVPKRLHEELINELKLRDCLNEERFATLFSQGKFRINGWGRQKIRYELKIKGLAMNDIETGVATITDEDYQVQFNKLFLKKIRETPANKTLSGRSLEKIKRYFYSRGWEVDLIQQALKEIKN